MRKINKMGLSTSLMILEVPERDRNRKAEEEKKGRRKNWGRKSQPWVPHCLFPSC